MKQAVLVNGVPASGKSTVSRAITTCLGWPYLALDTIKEPFFEQLGGGDRAFNRKLGRASYRAIFDLIADFPPNSSVVIDAWFGFQPIEVLTEHVERSGIGRVAEIWCRAPPDVVAARYVARVSARPAGHPGLDYATELVALAASARPLGRYPCLEIDTTLPIDDAALVRFLGEVGLKLDGAATR